MKRIYLIFAILLLCMQGMAQEKKDCCNSEINAAIENIMTRTSIRKFKAQKVEPCKVEKMLRAGMAAPTAVNKQPWHFVVVDKPELLAQMGRQAQQAPLAILVCGDFTKTLEEEGREFWIQDCSAATENILLAAHALGLGAVWTAAYPVNGRTKTYRSVLNIPEHIVPLCAILIGYPDESPAPKDKWKPENITYNAFE